jgi:photosystem II stability/assembly factor-like uncharacterized protein
MKNINLVVSKLILVFIIFSTSTLLSQTWQDIGNPSVGGEPVGWIHNIEGYQSGVYLCTDKGLFVSTDNGATFNNLTWATGITAGLPITCLFIDETDGTLYAGGETTIFTSDDNGSTWAATSVNTTAEINDIQKGATNIAAAYGNNNSTIGGVLYSTDGFATTQQAAGVPMEQMLDMIYYQDTFFLAGNAAMYASTDDGASWSVKGTGHPANGRYIKTLEQNTNLFSADINGKGLFKSTDVGETWSLTDPATFMDFCQVFDIAAGGGYLFAVVDGVNCSPEDIALRYSTDNGVTWSSALFNIPQAFYAELGATFDSSCFFVYAPFESKLYSSCDLPLGLNEATANSIIVYPNPTTGTINFSGLEEAKVTVYSALGYILGTYKDVSTQTKIDLSGYSEGIYFVQVETKEATSSFKILKK